MTTRGYQLFDRVSVTFPPTLYERIGVGYTSASGSIVALKVNKTAGAVVILDAVTVLECGRALVPQQVAGQADVPKRHRRASHHPRGPSHSQRHRRRDRQALRAFSHGQGHILRLPHRNIPGRFASISRHKIRSCLSSW
jgi:hypothetical protein